MCFLCGSAVQCGRRDLNSGSGGIPPLSGLTGETGGCLQVFGRAPAEGSLSGCWGLCMRIMNQPVSSVQSSIWETRSLKFSSQHGSLYCLHQNHEVIFMRFPIPHPRSTNTSISELSPESCNWLSYPRGFGTHWTGVNKFQFILYLQAEPLNSLFWPKEEPILLMCI